MADETEFLSETDVRDLVRLLGGVVAQEGDHAHKKRYLISGLSELIDADYWVWSLMCQPGNDQPQVYVNYVHGGFNEASFSQYLKVLAHPDMGWVWGPFFKELEEKQCHLTRTQWQVDTQDQFSKSPAFEMWSEAGLGRVMASIRPLDARSGSAVGFYRQTGKDHFTERERRMAHTVLTEVPWLHELGWPEDRGVTVPKLHPQQQIALNLLLDGMSRKEMAAQMKISTNTLSGYIRDIYRYFGVNSHAELIRRFFHISDRDS